jgi:hypothetical protein
MSNTNTGGPAFPAHGYEGMTLRDYFAAKAMQSILPSYQNVFDDETGSDDDPTFPELLAKDAYIMADAMLKARQA